MGRGWVSGRCETGGHKRVLVNVVSRVAAYLSTGNRYFWSKPVNTPFLRVRGILISKCGSGILGRPPLQIVEMAAGVGRRPMRAAYARRRPEDRAPVA